MSAEIVILITFYICISFSNLILYVILINNFKTSEHFKQMILLGLRCLVWPLKALWGETKQKTLSIQPNLNITNSQILFPQLWASLHSSEYKPLPGKNNFKFFDGLDNNINVCQ